jgi:hypothetical protein
MDSSTLPIDTSLPDTPVGLQARWSAELSAARDNQKSWWDRARKIVDRYVDDRKDNRTDGETRLNLYTSDTQTMESLLFGNKPKVDVERRFADSADDVARVAAEMIERILNTDLEKDSDTQEEAFKNALSDWLRPGFGLVRVRYEVEFDDTEQTDPEGEALQVKKPGSENVCVDYCYWEHILWSPARVFGDLRWVAFKAEMSEEEFGGRFPQHKAAFNANTEKVAAADDATKVKDPLARSEVWEIWVKDKRKVYWCMEGYTEILDQKDDPLGLEGFWPFPKPMVANLTTSKFLPTPDFVLAQDLYNEVDLVSTRITLLERAVRVVGVYDKTNDGIKRMISEANQNELIGVDQWAAFAERGGVKGAIDWLPLEMVVNALLALRDYRAELINLLRQITGMSDIMRGQSSQQTTATEQAIKARFASVRVQTKQDEFARFCSDTQRIKAEVISKHFDAQTIMERANVQYMPPNDQQLAPQAAELILSGKLDYRVSVNPDSVSLTDYAALKQERTEFAGALATYFQGMMPMIEALGAVGAGAPAVEFVLRMGQQLAAGLRGSSAMESTFDEFIANLEALQKQQAANPQQPGEDPKVQAEKVKADATMMKAKADVQKTVLDLQVSKQKHGMEMQKMQAEQHMAGQKMAMDQHLAGRQMENDSKRMDMEQEAAQADHNRSMQSQEGQERLQAMKSVDKVTGGKK